MEVLSSAGPSVNLYVFIQQTTLTRTRKTSLQNTYTHNARYTYKLPKQVCCIFNAKKDEYHARKLGIVSCMYLASHLILVATAHVMMLSVMLSGSSGMFNGNGTLKPYRSWNSTPIAAVA